MGGWGARAVDKPVERAANGPCTTPQCRAAHRGLPRHTEASPPPSRFSYRRGMGGGCTAAKVNVASVPPARILMHVNREIHWSSCLRIQLSVRSCCMFGDVTGITGNGCAWAGITHLGGTVACWLALPRRGGREECAAVAGGGGDRGREERLHPKRRPRCL